MVKGEKALIALVERDGYDPRDVVAVLRWALTAEVKPAAFWRQQVQGFARLRKRTDGISKFDQIYTAWKAATGGRPESPADPFEGHDPDRAGLAS